MDSPFADPGESVIQMLDDILENYQNVSPEDEMKALDMLDQAYENEDPDETIELLLEALECDPANVDIHLEFLDQSFLDDYLDVMAHELLYFVGVRCPLAVIEQREARRLGRFPGTAESHFISCHAHDTYDIEVDTSTTTPQACAELIVKRIATGPPEAFRQLAR